VREGAVDHDDRDRHEGAGHPFELLALLTPGAVEPDDRAGQPQPDREHGQGAQQRADPGQIPLGIAEQADRVANAGIQRMAAAGGGRDDVAAQERVDHVDGGDRGEDQPRRRPPPAR